MFWSKRPLLAHVTYIYLANHKNKTNRALFFSKVQQNLPLPLDVHSYRDETANVVYLTCPSISAARDLLDPLIDDCWEHPNQRNPTCHPDQSSKSRHLAAKTPRSSKKAMQPLQRPKIMGVLIHRNASCKPFSENGNMNHLCYTTSTSCLYHIYNIMSLIR